MSLWLRLKKVLCTDHDLCTRIMNACSTWNGIPGQFIINSKQFVREFSISIYLRKQ